jgi:hypothetical protein
LIVQIGPISLNVITPSNAWNVAAMLSFLSGRHVASPTRPR